ncbi:MAG TPA: hypothetical protein ENH82_07750, partial [bacterium]|nr:hypothetical protein [bacterium]
MLFGIRNRLILLLSIFSIVPVILLGIFAIKTGTDALMKNIGTASIDLSHSVTDRINDHLLHDYRDSLAWSKNELFTSALETGVNDKVVQLLENINFQGHDNHYIALVNREGKVIASSRPEIFPLEPYFAKSEGWEKALKGLPAFDEPSYEDALEDYSLNMYAPVKNSRDDSRIAGVLVTAFKWSHLNDMVSTMKIRGKTQDMADHVMVTMKNGLAISSYDPEEMFTENLINLGMASAKNAQDHKEGYLVEISEHNLKTFATYTYLPDIEDMPNPGWLVIILQDYDEIFSSIHSLQSIVALTSLFIITALLFSSFKLAG